jgi:hypothetical protein
MMTGSTLVMLVVLGQFPAADPDSLIPRLGAPRYADREDAASALVRLGRRALPALRSARDDKDPEVRTRAISLINKIEGSLLTQPTMISLDVDDRPLPEVIKTVSEQAGVSLVLIPDNSPLWASRKVTIHEPVPLPFWKAIDRLCEVARLQYNFGMYGMSQGRQPSFPLFDGGSARPALPTVDSGPFRISIMALHYQRDVTFPANPQRFGQPFPPQRADPPGSDGPRFNPAVTESCYAQIQVQGEPRLSVSQNGSLKITEAVDDKGQSLVNTVARGALAQRTAGYLGINASSFFQLQAVLSRPDRPGQVIRKLHGVLPITVATRKPNPLAVKLEGATGKTFRNDDVAVTVTEIRPLGNSRQTVIEMTIRPLSGTSGTPGLGQPDFVVQRPDAIGQTIEVSDGQGRLMPWYQTSFDTETAHLSLTATPQALDGQATPTELRLFGMARAATEIEFEFNDLPLP